MRYQCRNAYGTAEILENSAPLPMKGEMNFVMRMLSFELWQMYIVGEPLQDCS